MRILVVEDDSVSRKLITTILEKQNYNVVSTESAKEAVDWINQGNTVDLIISDVMMPEMDGCDLLRSVRLNARLKDIPFILCTSLGDRDAVLKGAGLGVAAHVVKPVEADVLLAKVRAIAVARAKEEQQGSNHTGAGPYHGKVVKNT